MRDTDVEKLFVQIEGYDAIVAYDKDYFMGPMYHRYVSRQGSLVTTINRMPCTVGTGRASNGYTTINNANVLRCTVEELHKYAYSKKKRLLRVLKEYR